MQGCDEATARMNNSMNDNNFNAQTGSFRENKHDETFKNNF